LLVGGQNETVSLFHGVLMQKQWFFVACDITTRQAASTSKPPPGRQQHSSIPIDWSAQCNSKQNVAHLFSYASSLIEHPHLLQKATLATQSSAVPDLSHQPVLHE